MLVTATADRIPGVELSHYPEAKAGQTYRVWTNSHGAVTAVMKDGTRLGLRPAEFEVDTWHHLAGEPTPQPHPDPIAWMVGTAFWWTKEEAERDAAETGLPIVGLGPMAGVAPTDQRQGEPAVLPMRKDPTESWEVPGGVSKAEGWNACLDEIAKLGPLYSRADPASLQRSWQAGYDTAWYAKNPAEKRTSVNPDDSAEVERLRDASRLAKHWCDAALNAIQMGSDNPGALNDVACLLRHMAKDLNSTAPASADPSAPECGHAACKSLGEPHPFCQFVKGLEQAEPRAPVELVCNCATRIEANHALSCLRAALERKPQVKS
ncbi:hypothetical protein [Pseudomonas fulva]|nr:hypothetical protein [Pseudomonas fulva]